MKCLICGKFSDLKCSPVCPVNQAELKSLSFSSQFLDLNTPPTPLTAASLFCPPREEERVPPAGHAASSSVFFYSFFLGKGGKGGGYVSYACACLVVSDPNRFASRHLATHPLAPLQPSSPPAHKTFIRAQPCAARNVRLNKSLRLRLTPKKVHQLCKRTYFLSHLCACVGFSINNWSETGQRNTK